MLMLLIHDVTLIECMSICFSKVIPADVFVDTRMFAMRSADHVRCVSIFFVINS